MFFSILGNSNIFLKYSSNSIFKSLGSFLKLEFVSDGNKGKVTLRPL
jgi:hypothetical protein